MKQTFGTRLLQAFTWWNGTTWGTSFTTWLRGEFVGEDEFGNRYFRTRKGRVDPALGLERRWVIYNGVAEASTIPPSWYRWMQHTSDTPPTAETYVPREWEKPHVPNLTGTAEAYRPRGSILRPDPEEGITRGYDAWTPGN
jgi:NADH:ubiquinone oxidoreductase subunit